MTTVTRMTPTRGRFDEIDAGGTGSQGSGAATVGVTRLSQSHSTRLSCAALCIGVRRHSGADTRPLFPGACWFLDLWPLFVPLTATSLGSRGSWHLGVRTRGHLLRLRK